MSDGTHDHGATEELDSLLGAYALDALDLDDRVLVDAYLERDAAARAEVDSMRETAASLALLPATAMDAPPELWQRIAGAIAADESIVAVPAGAVDELADRRSRRMRTRWMATLAAAAVIAVVVLGVQVVSLSGRLDKAHRFDSAAMAAAFDRATKVDGAREVGLADRAGSTLARVVLLPDGTGYLRGDRLAALPTDETYQLWAVTRESRTQVTVSAGVLGPDPRAVSFRASGPVTAFAITIERAGGVVTPTRTPIAQAAIT